MFVAIFIVLAVQYTMSSLRLAIICVVFLITEFPKSITTLVKNVPYLMFVIAGVVMMYVVIGLYGNLPRYIELHFFKPAFVASFIGK